MCESTVKPTVYVKYMFLMIMREGNVNINIVCLWCSKSSLLTDWLTADPIRTPVVWHLNHSAALPWHQVTSDGSLVLHHVDHSAEGVYVCHDNQGLLLHSVRLRLGRKCCCHVIKAHGLWFTSCHSLRLCPKVDFQTALYLTFCL